MEKNDVTYIEIIPLNMESQNMSEKELNQKIAQSYM